jgi:hypothetical protein
LPLPGMPIRNKLPRCICIRAFYGNPSGGAS